jgi:glyceraldehyde-3-phosphate dehydrogenase/erythrose-4-phosphate dehydrogenase
VAWPDDAEEADGMPTVAINGLGRIGRAALKILLDTDGLDVVAVNDIADPENLAYLLRYDTVYGALSPPGEHRRRCVGRRRATDPRFHRA